MIQITTQRMNVAQLISALQSLPGDLSVEFLCADGFSDGVFTVNLETCLQTGAEYVELGGYKSTPEYIKWRNEQ